MKAVLRLVWSYFTCTPVIRAFTFGGVAMMLAPFVALMTRGQSGELLWAATLGYLAFFLGSSLMPLMFGRLAQSHAARVLPHGRLKLLISAFLTVAIVALPLALITPLAYVAGVSTDASMLLTDVRLRDYTLQLAQMMYTQVLLFAGWLYLAMWFVTSQRNIGGMVKGLIVVLIMLYAPARQVQELSVSVRENLQQIAVIWGVFALGFLMLPRWKQLAARLRLSRFALLNRIRRQVSGREIDLVLGTANPWLLIAAQVLPILIASRIGDYSPAVWLFYLTIFSTVAGAIAGQAAERSRALWLRGNWSRSVLFSEVERSFWRHNSFVLGALIALMVAIGSFASLPVRLLAVGVPLLALGTILSTYLGLMLTRGLRWGEAVLGVGVMLALMAVAVLAASRDGGIVTVLAIEGVLAVLAIALRSIALRRWTQIDWMLCRPDRALTLRSA
jgi:hypothetical protein